MNSGPKAHILIVDDHPNTASLLARAVAQIGERVEVSSATGGQQALEIIQNRPADILITDMIMPDMNGLELVERLTGLTGARPAYTVLITAYEVPGLRVTARRAKVDEVIAKPVRPERIRQTVEKVLNEWDQVPHPAKQEATARPATILIADDLPDNITLLSRYLEREGYEYLSAMDGVEALEKARAYIPDLLLLDVNMPRKDGFAVLEEVRADPTIQHIPVIILTAARLDPIDVQSGFNLGADDYVTKPFDRRELMARIRTKLRVKQAEDEMRRRNRELGLLPELGKELSARLDLQELSEILLRRTVETLGALLGYLVIKTEGGFFQRNYHIPGTHVGDEIPLPHKLFDIVSASQEGFIINETRTDDRWQGMPTEQIRSAVVAPLFGRQTLLGLLILVHEQENYFPLEHMLLLQAIVGQAAIAVENASLYSGLAREQKRLSALIQSAADAILMFDANDCLSMINPAGERLFTDYEARIGLPLAHGTGYDSLLTMLEKAYDTNSPQQGEVTWPDQRMFASLVTPIEDGGNVVTLHDITHFKDLERIKNEFIATASHDLKNPIATITGFSALMEQAGSLNDMQKDFVERIQAASNVMNELVQNLLQLVQLDMTVDTSLKSEAVNLDELVARVAHEYAPQAEAKAQELSIQRGPIPSIVQGDAQQLTQALRNLVGNAIKYTPREGKVGLSQEIVDGHAVLHVRDTGYGIPADHLPRIFNRFHRVRTDDTKDIEGNGLGLAIVKSIVERHSGQISVDSAVGQGSCFTVLLPLASPFEATETRPEKTGHKRK